MQAPEVFRCGFLVCMGMAIYSGYKIAPKKKKLKSLKIEYTPRRNKRAFWTPGVHLFSSQIRCHRPNFHHELTRLSGLPQKRSSPIQHTRSCRSMIFSQSGILSRRSHLRAIHSIQPSQPLFQFLSLAFAAFPASVFSLLIVFRVMLVDQIKQVLHWRIILWLSVFFKYSSAFSSIFL